MKIENQIKLTNTAKVLIKHLNKKMDELEHTQLIVILIDTKSEEETGVPAVNDLMISEFEEVGHFRLTGDDHTVRLNFNSCTFFFVIGYIPPGQPGLTLSILEEDETDLIKK